MSKIESIAILGANSQIALDYIEFTLRKTESKLYLFSRNPQFLRSNINECWKERVQIFGYEQFISGHYEAIINFVGGSDPAQIASLGKDIINITDQYDYLSLEYLKKNKNCIYIFASSGAAYGNIFEHAPARESIMRGNKFSEIFGSDYYGFSKFMAEERHRNLIDLKIVDVRVFSYISNREKIKSNNLISEILKSIHNKKIFITSSENIWRDYSNAEDFFELTECILNHNLMNLHLDLYTKAPTSKLKIIELFIKEKNLKVDFINTLNYATSKKYYYSKNYNAKKIGFIPTKSSIENINSFIKNL